MTVIIISALSSIFSGLVLFFVKNFFKKQEKRESERSITRAKENILILKSIDAIGKLTYANTIAIRDGKVNGEITDSLQAYNEVKEEMYDYLLEQNARR
ncbi:MAG: hypothetical protein WCU90_10630 [Kiritimatiellia bacterium]|jgi:hypothetical protein